MPVAELSIPQGWDEITAEWMTAALARDFPGVQVGDVAVVLRDDGTNRRARLQLTYSAGAGPATVFAKAVDPEHADLVALTSGLYHGHGCSPRESFCHLTIQRSTRRSSMRIAATF
jgi:hypothetical protein